jgi:hypothetical protein
LSVKNDFNNLSVNQLTVAVQTNKIATQLVGNEGSGETVSDWSHKHVNLGCASKESFGKEALLCFAVFHVKQFRSVVHAPWPYRRYTLQY